MKKLEREEVINQLKGLSNWTFKESSIQKKITFKSFNECMIFINEVANIANELHHHPEWCNVYNKLEIKLTTHDVDGLSNLDFIFAEKIDLLIKNTY